MKLRVRALGLAVGTVWGLGLFVATLIAVVRGAGHTLVLLKAYYYGYDVSIGGAFCGLLWGFLDGFIIGALIAWCYNYLLKVLYKS
jgi:hypothetical protein